MAISIIVNLKSCDDCRHFDHSGAFTPGGAKPICNHDGAVQRAKSLNKKDPYDWRHRVLPQSGKIPEWCPLKCGGKY